MKHTNSSLFSISYSVSASSAAAAGANKNTSNTNTNTRQNTDDDDVRNDPVFRTEGEAIDEDGYIVQYFKEEKNGFTIDLLTQLIEERVLVHRLNWDQIREKYGLFL